MKVQHVPVIAVDGPSGTGKGTLCMRLAAKLDWHLLDSGAIYRVLAHAALQDGIDLQDESRLSACAIGLDLEFRLGSGGDEPLAVWLRGLDVTRDIRTEEGGKAASQVAVFPKVREALLARQQSFRSKPGLIADGRDMGTVVFPNADLKIYLTASPEERAQRRYKQLKQKGVSVTLQALFNELMDRDRRDQQRQVAPLKPASDAVVIDTSEMSAEQVEARVMALVEKIIDL